MFSELKAENSDNPKSRRGQQLKPADGVGARIVAALKGRPRKWLAERAEIPESTVSDYIARGIAKAGAAVGIARALNVSVDWLLTGKEPSIAGDLAEDSEVIRIPAVKDLAASAGPGSVIEPFELTGEAAPFPAPWLRKQFGQIDGLKLIQVRGISMEPLIADGAWVLMDVNRKGMSPGVYVVRLDDALQVKRLEWRNKNCVTLISQNPAMKPIELDLSGDGDPRDFAVIGRVLLTGNFV